ncbi:hypothetical protein N665_2038s0001, partial [Sinapis alba]
MRHSSLASFFDFPCVYDCGNQKVMESLLLGADRTCLESLTPGEMCSRRVWSHSTPSVTVTELDLVRGVLQAMQGLSSPFILWDQTGQTFLSKTTEIRVSHLSRTSLHALLSPFLYAATCLKLVECILAGINNNSPPTLMAFSNSVSAWLQKLRDISLNEEVKINDSTLTLTPTLLGLTSSLSSLCSGAEYLLQVVRGAIPHAYFDSSYTISTAEVAVHVLDFLYKKLDQVCLVQGGEVV